MLMNSKNNKLIIQLTRPKKYKKNQKNKKTWLYVKLPALYGKINPYNNGHRMTTVYFAVT